MESIAFKGELQLLGWSESDKGGRVVKFQCGGDEADHPFKHFPSKARFMCVLVQIGDDEKPVQQPERERLDLLSNVCARLCKDGDFWTWIEGQVWGVPVTSEGKAAAVVKELLGIESRSELDDDAALAQRFTDEMLTPYRQWQAVALAARKVNR